VAPRPLWADRLRPLDCRTPGPWGSLQASPRVHQEAAYGAAHDPGSWPGQTPQLPATKPATAEENTIKAIVRNTYGSPDVLELRETDKPDLTDDGVLVRVHAASINAGD